MSTTIEKLLSGVPVETGRGGDLAERHKVKVLDGLKAKRPPVPRDLSEDGIIQVFTPEELLSINVAVVGVNGRVVGYQRDLDVRHARKVGEWMKQGKPLPTAEIGVDGHGEFWFIDGQHRGAGAVIARAPLAARVRRLTKQQQAELFFSQRRAKTLDPNVLVLAGTSAFDRYVQDAVASHGSHPWRGIVSASRRSKTKITPYSMFQLLIRFVANTDAQGAGRTVNLDEKWDKDLADRLAPLIASFGNKQTNPLAFRPGTLQSIGSTAMYVFRRHEEHVDDYDRWMRHMPMFPFEQWLHVRTQTQMTSILLDHWNKRLSSGRKVIR